MADINQVITLGIGTPSSIPHFVLVGLSPSGASAGPAYGTDDLTTAVCFYLPTLLPGDQTTEFRQYADSVRGTTNEDDLNTAMWLDLNF